MGVPDEKPVKVTVTTGEKLVLYWDEYSAIMEKHEYYGFPKVVHTMYGRAHELRSLKEAQDYIKEAQEYILEEGFAYIPPTFKKIYKGTLRSWWNGKKLLKGMICSYCGGEAHANLHYQISELSIYQRPPKGAKDMRIRAESVPFSYLYQVTGSVKCTQCGYEAKV
jgi:hypothetical protein